MIRIPNSLDKKPSLLTRLFVILSFKNYLLESFCNYTILPFNYHKYKYIEMFRKKYNFLTILLLFIFYDGMENTMVLILEFNYLKTH